MKTLKKILSFLTVICCLAGSLLPLQAAEAEEIPRVTFTNEPKMEANLYVTKTVESAREGQTLPESEKEKEFTFTLKLGGSGAGNAAGNVIYHKFGADGNEILVPVRDSYGNLVEDSSGVKMTYPQTSAYGRFTLKSGERAEFRSADIEGLRSGTYYEVTEEVPRNYQEVTYGGTAQGYLEDNGTTAAFVNQYVNPQTAGLEVQKAISGILVGRTEYEVPDFLMPEKGFKFRLILGKEKAVGEPFRIVDMETNRTLENGVTDVNGIFFLPGGCKAVFEGGSIRPDMDYQVQELRLDGAGGTYWSPVGDTGMDGFEPEAGDTEDVAALQEGSTSGNPVAYFKNAAASFGVSKKMEDGSTPDAVFTFELTDSNYAVIGNAPYLVYEISEGTLVTNQNCRATGEDGRFTLQPGQMAVFVGMEVGKGYNVCEVKTGDQNQGQTQQYIQVVPEKQEGYTDKTVTASFEVLPFENKPLTGGLAVTKAVVNESQEAAFDRDVEFRFTLYKVESKTVDGEAGEELKPQKNVYYVIERGGTEYTYTTDQNGVFILKAYETALFTRLPSGTYRIVEDVSGVPEYSVSPEEGSTITTIAQDAVYVQGQTVGVTFTNYYVPQTVNLKLTKVDGDKNPLAGAKFELYRDEAETNPVTALMADGGKAVYTVGGGCADTGNAGAAGSAGDGNGNADSADDNGNAAHAANAGDGGNEDSSGNDAETGTGGSSGPGGAETEPEWRRTYETPENGVLEIQGLKPGTYYLREMKAPSGYILLPNPIKIQIHWKGDDAEGTKKTLEVVVDDGKYDASVVDLIQVSKEKENLVEITIVNSELYELPNSGGMGIYWYSIGGILLMTGAVLILYKNKRVGEVQRD